MRTPAKTPTATTRRLNRRTTKGPSKRGSLFNQVKSLQRIVRNLAPEQKYVDVDISSTDISTSGRIVHLTGVAQGDTQSTRTGNSINVTSVTLRGKIVTPSSATPNTDPTFRWAIVVDREQVADTSPSAGAIFAGPNPITGLPNLDNLERFRILFLSGPISGRRLGVDSSDLSPPTISAYMQWQWTGNLKVAYNGTASTDIEKNGIYFVFLSDDSSDTIDVVGFSRIAYTDV